MIKVVTVTKYKCEDCGTTVSREAKYCSECGDNLQETITYQETETKIWRD